MCYAGFKGAACDTQTPRPNECNKMVGINLEGMSDWAHSWVFTDVMKTGRAWLSQVGAASGVGRGGVGCLGVKRVRCREEG